MREGWSGLFWLVISILVCAESVRVKIGTFHNPGPGFLPFLAGGSLGVFSLILVALNLLDKRKKARIGDLWGGREWGKVVLALTFLLLYTVLLTKLGYLIGTFGLMLFLFGTIGKTKLWIRTVAALFTTLTTYVIFYTWLGIPLPKGILGF
jgi:putative tricarboxylic transport membrane protein